MSYAYASDDKASDLGRFVLRVGLGLMILLHGVAKIIAGPGFIVGLLAKAGLPSMLAWGVYVGEVVVTGMVKGTAFDHGNATLEAGDIAARFWQLYTARGEHSVTI